MARVLFLLQSATPTPADAPEKFPAWLTLVFLIGIAFVALLLLIGLVRGWFSRKGGAAQISLTSRLTFGGASARRQLIGA